MVNQPQLTDPFKPSAELRHSMIQVLLKLYKYKWHKAQYREAFLQVSDTCFVPKFMSRFEIYHFVYLK